MDVRDHGILIRSRAIGMLEGGTMQKEVAQCLGVSVPSVKRWWSSHKHNKISTLDELIKSITFAWEGIGSDILENLVASMPERIRLVL